MLDDATISAAMDQVGTAWERLDGSTWRAVIPSEHTSFRLFLRRVGGWLRLQLSPFVPTPADPAVAAALFREVLERNRTLMEARFALADDGDVILEAVVEEQAARPALDAALDALVAAAQYHYPALARFK